MSSLQCSLKIAYNKLCFITPTLRYSKKNMSVLDISYKCIVETQIKKILNSKGGWFWIKCTDAFRWWLEHQCLETPSCYDTCYTFIVGYWYIGTTTTTYFNICWTHLSHCMYPGTHSHLKCVWDLVILFSICYNTVHLLFNNIFLYS